MSAEISASSKSLRIPSIRIAPVLAAVCWFVAGLAISRLLFEAMFPTWGWIGRPIPASAIAAIAAVVGALIARRWKIHPAAFLPLLINLFWLADPAVHPARGCFLLAASWWLTAMLLVWGAIGDGDRRWRWLGPVFVIAALLPVYLATMSAAVGAADTFEFQVVAPQLGIAHPTGYPLYLLLGKLASLLPFGTVAWRLNLASAVFAAAAAAVVFRMAYRLFDHPLPALAGAVVLGLVPIFWSQAIIAEVYGLHALIVAVALRLMMRLTVDHRPQTADDRPQNTDYKLQNSERRPSSGDRSRLRSSSDRKTMVALAFVLGLGLANHLTTVFLLPPAALAVMFNLWPAYSGRRSETGSRVSRRRSLIPLFLQLLIAFAVPLLLYAYLPLRWAAVNGEPMGFGRFVEWVAGGRFQGALQWSAWLRDPARREIVARLFLDAWGWFYLVVATEGLVWLFARQWRAALLLLITATGFTFYALNYYVPDLAVFLIPAHVVIAVWVAAGVKAISGIGRVETEFFRKNSVSIAAIVFVVALLPMLLSAGGRWASIDQSGRDGGETWARGVLAQPLARGAAILADSEKIAPLYYLQQIEGLRPDLDIMVLPDEAAYRAELDSRLANGQAVYLARYLPGLAGVYHLRSAGPLVEASREPLTALPSRALSANAIASPLHLVGYSVEPVSAVDPDAAGLTLYWSPDRPLAEGESTPVVYLRWAGGEVAVNGAHPSGDSYPINAWRSGEIVPDFHLLPLPDVNCGAASCDLAIELAIAPRFTPAADLEWQPVASVPVAPRLGPVGEPRRALFDGFALDGIDFPATARPGTTLPLRYSGFGDGRGLTFLLVPPHATDSLIIPADRAPDSPDAPGSTAFSAPVDPATEAGPHVLIAYATGETDAVCGWLAWPTTGCVVAEIAISGAPLANGATNFDDRIALLGVDVADESFAPGGKLPVILTWQGLAEMNEDYTVFVQVLDAADRIVGQMDAWPVQGTRPTSTWQPGDTIIDPYNVQLSPDLPPGDYRLHVGLYLLATGQRLSVLDSMGNAVDDKFEVGISGQ